MEPEVEPTEAKRIEIDFSKPSPDRDFGLKIEEQIFWVSRQGLANVSPVFNAMLFGGFQEAKKGVVELKDKDSEQILEMLRCVFDGKVIDQANIDSMAQLGDEYQIEPLMEKCSDFVLECLKAAKDIDGKMKSFLMAIRYRYKKSVRRGIKEISKYMFSELQPYLQEIPVEIQNAVKVVVAAVKSEHYFEHVRRSDAPCGNCDRRSFLSRSKQPFLCQPGGSVSVSQPQSVISGDVTYRCKYCGYTKCDKCGSYNGTCNWYEWNLRRNKESPYCRICHTCRRWFGSAEICCECVDAGIIPCLEKIGL